MISNLQEVAKSAQKHSYTPSLRLALIHILSHLLYSQCDFMNMIICSKVIL